MPTSRNTTKLHLYRSLDTLKILTFWEIIKTKNACLLDFDYFETKRYTNEQQNEIAQLFIRLYDEFYVLRNNKESKMEIDKGFETMTIDSQIVNIEHNRQFLVKLKDFIGVLPDDDIKSNEFQVYDRVKNLEKLGNKIKIDYEGGIDVNIRMLERVMNSLQNTKYLNEGKVREKIKQEINNVYEVVGMVEAELNRNLIIEDVVCSRWIVYENQALEKQRLRKRDG